MQHEPKNILIIDDDTLVAELLAALLASQSYLTMVANSAEDGLTAFKETSYDLVLCDIFMKGMGGIEGIRKTRVMKPDIPIIAMSAGYSGMEPEEALEAAKITGAAGVLAKPFEPKIILSVIATFLSNTRTPKANDLDSGKS